MLAKYRVLLVAIATLAAIACLAIVCFVLTGKSATDESLRVLMRNTLQLHYEIEKGVNTDSFVDLGGEWRVRLLGKVNDGTPFDAQLNRADEADVAFFKSRVMANSLSEADLTGYQLFRTDLQLGKRTICEVSKCKVYVLRKNGAETAFVGIYKN